MSYEEREQIKRGPPRGSDQKVFAGWCGVSRADNASKESTNTMDAICSRKECSSWLTVNPLPGRLSPIEVMNGVGGTGPVSRPTPPVSALIMIQPAPVTGSFPNAPVTLGLLSLCQSSLRSLEYQPSPKYIVCRILFPSSHPKKPLGTSAHTPSTIHEFYHNYFTDV